jgi:signal transduction histidine kinase
MSHTRSVAKDPAGPTVADRALTVFALLFMVVLATVEAKDGDAGLLAVLTIAGFGLLLARHRWPVATLAAVLVVDGLHIAYVPLADPVQFTSIPVPTMVVVYTIATRLPWRHAWLYGGVAALVVLLVGTFARDGERLAANAFTVDLMLGAIGAGVLVRSRHQRVATMQQRAELAEHTKEDEARRRVASERLRMARELHDVVAHHLTLVNAQSSVAQYLIHTDPHAAEKALENLTQHTRLALDELRSTVGLLRQVDDDSGDAATDDLDELGPMPGVPHLPALIGQHTAMPGAVSLTVSGQSRTLPALTSLAAYRIIQEALTNARKYSPGSDVGVRLGWQPTSLEISIRNGSPALAPLTSATAGTGHGLLGMRERAMAAHGSLEAGPQADGGWLVEARLPIDPEVEGSP